MGSSNPINKITKPYQELAKVSALGSNFAFTGRNIIGGKSGIDTALDRPKRDAEKKAKLQAELASTQANMANQLAEATRQREIAQESVRRQKEQARRRTIFAGGFDNQSIFKKVLGA